jgi:hypothetical protein
MEPEDGQIIDRNQSRLSVINNNNITLAVDGFFNFVYLVDIRQLGL